MDSPRHSEDKEKSSDVRNSSPAEIEGEESPKFITLPEVPILGAAIHSSPDAVIHSSPDAVIQLSPDALIQSSPDTRHLEDEVDAYDLTITFPKDEENPRIITPPAFAILGAGILSLPDTTTDCELDFEHETQILKKLTLNNKEGETVNVDDKIPERLSPRGPYYYQPQSSPSWDRRMEFTERPSAETLEGAVALSPKLTERIKPMTILPVELPSDEETEDEDEEEEEVYYHPEFAMKVANTLMTGVFNLFQHQELCDLTVTVEEEEFKCHKVIMAAMSGFFHSLLMSEMKETTDDSVTLETVSAKTFSRVLRVIYGGQNVVTGGMVENLLKASVYLQIRILEMQCVDYLYKTLDVSNAIGMWRLAQMYELRPLIRKSWQVILDHFDQISRLDEILTLQKEEMILIITESSIQVLSEDVICDTVLRWVKHDLAARESDLDILLEFICLPKVSGPYLYDTLFTDQLMTTNKRFAELVKEALCYHLKEEQREAIMARQPTLRANKDIHKVVVLVGGYVIKDQSLKSTMCYNLHEQQWYTIASIPHDPGMDFATCCLRNELYLGGGSRSMDGFVKFVPVENQWYRQPSLITGRERHAMVAVGDVVYVLGGSCSVKKGSKLPAEVEGYDTKSGRWFAAGHLQIPLESLSATVVKDTIFTFGGIGNGGMPSSSIQSFDTVTGSCSLYGSLPHPTGHTVTLALHSVIYIVCPKGQVLQFSAEDKQVKQIVQIPNMDRVGFGVYTHEGNLVVVGGESPDGNLSDTIVQIDLTRKKSTRSALPIPMAMFHMEIVKIPKRLLIQQGFNIFQQGEGMQFDFESMPVDY